MKNSRLTNIILILLLLFNVAFLGRWWYGHWKMHRMNRRDIIAHEGKAARFLCRELNFTPMQQARLDSLRNLHEQRMSMLQYSVSLYEREMLNAVAQNPADSARAFLFGDSAGRAKTAILRELYRHFSAVRKICTPEQIVRFDELMKLMSDHCSYHNAEMPQDANHTDTNSK